MTTMARNDTQAVREILSPAARWGQLAEECMELGQVALKMQRHCMEENPPRDLLFQIQEKFLEELADVMNALSVVDLQPHRDQVMQVRKQKMARWAAHLARLEEAE